PDHRAVARRLAPVIWSILRPTSVRDIGCGAGYWLEALQDFGVRSVDGISPAPSGDPAPAVAAMIARGPIDQAAKNERCQVCLCLEVGQHLTPDRHDALVAA